MVRGEIYFFDPAPRSGSEVKGPRPCILVSDNEYGAHPLWKTITVIPLSSAPRWLESSPTRVQFDAGECGFPKRCATLTQQITTIDKIKLKGSPIGRLTPEKEAELAEALRNYLAI